LLRALLTLTAPLNGKLNGKLNGSRSGWWRGPASC
jgi:hypothetical protein